MLKLFRWGFKDRAIYIYLDLDHRYYMLLLFNYVDEYAYNFFYESCDMCRRERRFYSAGDKSRFLCFFTGDTFFYEQNT